MNTVIDLTHLNPQQREAVESTEGHSGSSGSRLRKNKSDHLPDRSPHQKRSKPYGNRRSLFYEQGRQRNEGESLGLGG